MYISVYPSLGCCHHGSWEVIAILEETLAGDVTSRWNSTASARSREFPCVWSLSVVKFPRREKSHGSLRGLWAGRGAGCWELGEGGLGHSTEKRRGLSHGLLFSIWPWVWSPFSLTSFFALVKCCLLQIHNISSSLVAPETAPLFQPRGFYWSLCLLSTSF